MTFSSGEVLTAANLNAFNTDSIVVSNAGGTWAAGALGFTDSNWGFVFYPPQAGAIAAHAFASSAGSTLMSITDAGNVGIGTTTPMRTLDVATDIVLHEGDGANLLTAVSDGELAVWQQTSYTSGDSGWSRVMRIGQVVTGNSYFNCQLVYDRTAAGVSGNVYTSSNGLIRRATSSGRYKKDIETLWDEEADKVLTLRPVWFRSAIELDRPDWAHEGFIAEEVAEINPRWVEYGPIWETVEETGDDGETKEVYALDEDGERITELDANGEEVLRPESVHYPLMIPALVNIMKRQQTQIDALTARVEALEA